MYTYKIDIDKIRDKCWDKRTTVAGLERSVGLKNGAISKWSNSSPRLDNVMKVAEYLDCTIYDLLVSEL